MNEMKNLREMRKGSVIALICAVLYIFYWYWQDTSIGLNFFQLIMSSYVGPSFWIGLACFIIGAYTPPLFALVIYLIGGFTNGFATLWGIACIILAVIAFSEWRQK